MKVVRSSRTLVFAALAGLLLNGLPVSAQTWRDRARDSMGNARDAANQRGHQARESAQRANDRAREAATQRARQAQEAAQRANDRAREAAAQQARAAQEAARRAEARAREEASQRARQAQEATQRAAERAREAASQQARAAQKTARRADSRVREEAGRRARQAQEAAQRASGRTREVVAQQTRSAQDAARRIEARTRERPASQRAQQVLEASNSAIAVRGRKLVHDANHRLRDRWNGLRPDTAQARRQVSDHYAMLKSAQARMGDRAAQDFGPRINQAVGDPDNQRKALEMAGTALEVRRQIRGLRNHAIHRAIDGAFSLPVNSEAGPTTVGGATQQWIEHRMPFLAQPERMSRRIPRLS